MFEAFISFLKEKLGFWGVSVWWVLEMPDFLGKLGTARVLQESAVCSGSGGLQATEHSTDTGVVVNSYLRSLLFLGWCFT